MDESNKKKIQIHYAVQASAAKSRWSYFLLTTLASTTGQETTTQAVIQRSGSYYYGGRPNVLSSIKQVTDSPESAVSLVKHWTEHPDEVLSLASQLQKVDLEDIRQHFAASTIVAEIDGSTEICPGWSQCVELAKSGKLPISLALGQTLEVALSGDDLLSEEIKELLVYFLDNVPFQVGHWGAFKRIFKQLEARQDAAEIFTHALVRVDANSRHGHKSRIPVEDLSMLSPFFPDRLASEATLGYLSRRGRRYFRTLSKTNTSAYCETAVEFLRIADRIGQIADISQRWILADLLFARGVRDKSHGRGSVELPELAKRYNRRWDRKPRLWNSRIALVSELWKNVSGIPEIQIWAFNVLKSTKSKIPQLSRAGLKLALLSPAKSVRTFACEQIANAPLSFSQLDNASAVAFLTFSTNKQFKPVLQTLDSQADSSVVQQAVFDFANEHGLHGILRGDKVENLTLRQKALFGFTLRHIRNQLNDAETLNLALYVGETDKFRSLTLWEKTLNSLPFKILIELRLQLPQISNASKATIDAACRYQALSGSQDRALALALVHSPSHSLRKLAWDMLTASDTTAESFYSVWNALAEHATNNTGIYRLQESLYDKTRVTSLVGHNNVANLLVTISLALAKAGSPAAKRALTLLANTKNASAIASCLEHFSNDLPEWRWEEEKSLFSKLTSKVPGVFELIWRGFGEDKYYPLVASIKNTPSIIRSFFNTIDLSDLIGMNSIQAMLFQSMMEALPTRLIRDRALAISAATSPHMNVAVNAILLLESRDAIGNIYMQLFESGLPSAMAAAQRFVRQQPAGDRLTGIIISICDSGVKEVRRIGIQFLKQRQGEYNTTFVYSALSEHKAPDITEAVARYVASGGEVRGRGVRRFEDRVLRTRRHGRKTKNLVKERISAEISSYTNQQSLNRFIGAERIQSLLAMATGASKRDREWALQELVRLKGAGIDIPELSVSRTS